MKSLHLLGASMLALSLSLPAMAAGADEHAGHHSEKPAADSTPADTRMDELRARMRAMREEHDPQKRMELMRMQMKDMAAMREHMQAGGMMGQDAKGGMKGKRGMGMGGGMHDMMERRMEMMDMRMEMMQMMMEPKAADAAATK